MSQTTGQISFKDCKVETSLNGSSWTDISGFAASVMVDGGERMIGKEFTFDGDTPLMTGGKRDLLEVTVKSVYTEGASDPIEVFRAAYEACSAMYLRWSPKNGQAGEFQYTTGAGIVKTSTYPSGEAESPDPVTLEVTVAVPSIAKSVAS